MECFHPIRVPATMSPAMYKAWFNKDPIHFKLIHKVDENGKRFISSINVHDTVRYIDVPCGKCPACLRNRQLGWSFRLENEAKSRLLPGLFVTLTYSDKYLPKDGQLCKKDLQVYFKNLRYRVPDMVYYACGEYGAKYGRPHYHYVLWSDSPIDWHYISSCWYRGCRVDIKPFIDSRGAYVCKYTMKQIGFDYADKQPPFALMSKSLGLSFVYKFHYEDGKRVYDKGNLTFDAQVIRALNLFTVTNRSGRIIPLPRYYKELLYTPEQIAEHSVKCCFDNFDRMYNDKLYLEHLWNREQHFIELSKDRLRLAQFNSVL